MPKIRRYKTYSFPYLAEFTNDYKKSEFLLDVTHTHRGKKILLKMSYFIKNDELKELILNGDVDVVAKIVCPVMGFSKTVTFDKGANTKEVEYRSMELDGEVTLTAFLVSKVGMKYSNKDLSKEWAEEAVFLMPNNIIGETEDRIVSIRHLKSGTKKSIFQFTKKVDMKMGDAYRVRLNDPEAIIFELPLDDWASFEKLRKKNVESIISLYLIPTLTDILRQMITPIEVDENGVIVDDNNDFNKKHSSKNWYKVICANYEKALEGKNAEKGEIEPLEAAQLIISKFAIHNVVSNAASKF